MILQQFPDLGWLKEQIRRRFQQRRAFNNLPLDTAGFPSVIINTKATQAYRPDVMGPISLFLNRRGTSSCTTEGRRVQINESFFYISNRFQPYTLEIESRQPVETFNIHFGEHFSEGVLGALLTPADKILNDGLQQSVHTVAFYNRLHSRDEQFNLLVKGLRETKQGNHFDKLLFEERMAALLNYLLVQHRNILKQVQNMPALKSATRAELYRRLSCSLDYIHSGGQMSVELDHLASLACLSKYHFLRLFRQTFGVSPHQYIQQLRMEKAKRLLKHSTMAVRDIAEELGFENSQSFSRLFHQRTGLYPAAYRE